MKKLLIAAALVLAGTSAALAQGYVYYGGPYVSSPGYTVYNYVPSYAPTYYGYAPGGGYGYYDESGNSYRQPSPRSTIRAVR
jgi:opacity protein-like surface antigen